MLCDELVDYDVQGVRLPAEPGKGEFVKREAVNEAIAELKQKLHDAEMRADLAEAACTERKIDYDNLKKDLTYHARQIYFKLNRQTLRALWIARSNMAKYFSKCWKEFYDEKAKYNFKKWQNVERLCRKKADEFKE